MATNPNWATNGTYSGTTAPVIRVYPPASAVLSTDLLEMSGAFTFSEFLNGQAIFLLTAAQPGNTGRVIQCGGYLPTITQGKPFSLITFPPNVILCWVGGAGAFNGLMLRFPPFLGLTA